MIHFLWTIKPTTHFSIKRYPDTEMKIQRNFTFGLAFILISISKLGHPCKYPSDCLCLIFWVLIVYRCLVVYEPPESGWMMFRNKILLRPFQVPRLSSADSWEQQTIANGYKGLLIKIDIIIQKFSRTIETVYRKTSFIEYISIIIHLETEFVRPF